MNQSQGKQRLACLIVAHNLGDAVIQSSFLKELVALGYADKYLVWTRPQVAFLFSEVPGCEVICSQFPVGTSKQMGGAAVLTFLKAAWQVRQRRPSVTIDLIGDLRDRLFATLAGTPCHLYPEWAEGHPFKRLIRNPMSMGKPFVVIPVEVPNVYAAYNMVLHKLMPNALRPIPLQNINRLRPPGPLCVGLHPFASQVCKLWPDSYWRDLASGLLSKGVTLKAFGAPKEITALHALFGQFGSHIELVTRSIEDFVNEVALLDVLIGLDSFSVHVAQRQGIRAVMINAGNHPTLWAPPNGTLAANSGGCAHYPCYNVPKCIGTHYESVCIRSVSVTQVAQLAMS